jgi:SET domain-containing protein
VVESRESVIHGSGLFATQAIAAGTRMLKYIGERIGKAEASRRCEAGNHFIFTLDDDTDIDGDVPENIARFANHSCLPNSEAEIEGEEIWIVAIRDIAPGDEITYNYGYDLEEYLAYPCRCGSAQCIGYMVAEEHFEHVRLNQGCKPANALGDTLGTRV